jgi:hypothetical protein
MLELSLLRFGEEAEVKLLPPLVKILTSDGPARSVRQLRAFTLRGGICAYNTMLPAQMPPYLAAFAAISGGF